MKNYIINKSLNFIKLYNDYNETRLSEIKYGLEAIYLLISKLIIIILLAWYLNILKEFIIFALIYNLIRMPSFGLHATKSWICLVSSIIIFISIPIISKFLIINIYIKSLLCIICILMFYKNSPADTHKKPIISQKRRFIYKFITVLIAIVFSIISLILNNNYLSNLIILSLITQNFMISPYIYKFFGLPYNNYINYIKTNNLNAV